MKNKSLNYVVALYLSLCQNKIIFIETNDSQKVIKDFLSFNIEVSLILKNSEDNLYKIELKNK